MAHHQHHGAEYDAQVSRSLQSRPTSTTLPSISEDEQVGDADEPPDHVGEPFLKTKRYPFARRESLITRSLHTDSESHDDEHAHFNTTLNHIPSISSTTSTHSLRSVGDFTSDDGHSQGTRPSTPGSPRSVTHAQKSDLHTKISFTNLPTGRSKSEAAAVPAPAPERAVEAQLGRKRCITFACGRKVKEDACKKAAEPTKAGAQEAAPKKQPTIKFNCPFKGKGQEPLSASKRHLSPAPGAAKNMAAVQRVKTHRGSDATVKNVSPKPSSSSIRSVRKVQSRGDEENLRFHEFASDDEDAHFSMAESKAAGKNITVEDTLQKEYAIRKLAQECEEEALEEGHDDDLEDFPDLDDDDMDEDDAASDDGFQTDDELGFAESDDDEAAADSDYEWWTAGRRDQSPASPFSTRNPAKLSVERTSSETSLENDSSSQSPVRKPIRKTKSKPVPVRPGTPELPDSTDFVCGTFDEDKPLEQAYKSCIKLRQAAKHRTCPQDIDPSFPTSDPELESEDEQPAAEAKAKATAQKSVDEPRGRRMDNYRRPSPGVSPARPRSPPVRATRKSPAPKPLFNHSPRPRMRSPPPATKLRSPPPSRRGSFTNEAASQAFGHAFLGDRRELTHTASLPRSPHPLMRRRMVPQAKATRGAIIEDDGDETEQPGRRYTRGAVDIVQGLEQKRLKRRQKFYEKYNRVKGDKKKAAAAAATRKPQPGVGAQRMRQVGLECAVYRGARVLSI